MIDGKTHTQLIYNILKDGKDHFTREFIDAGLLEYRRRVSDLREQGHVIKSIRIGSRPGYQLEYKKDFFTI